MSCHGGGNAVQTCRSEVDSGSFQIGFCGSTGYDGLTSLTVPGDLFYGTQASWSSSSAYIYAPLIQMNWKASDLSPTQSQTSQTPDPQTLVQSPSPATTAPSSTPSSQPTTIQNDSSSGLSNGGKIAVGVAVPLGVLAICFIAICFWLRSRRRKQTHAPVVLPEQRGIEESKRGGYHEAGQYSPGIQLDSKTAPQELSSSRSVVAGRHELMGSTGRSLRRSAG
ncbi:hypothetical protein MMC10_001925 [Thelotrema lepadinum]|nr:hypothetical protein [Thelotrema lepadinum]